MAKETIDVGNKYNDGLGDPLRDAFVKANANFTELYNLVDTFGWGYYVDDISANQTITSTASVLTIDGAGSTIETYLPKEIRGTGSLWDVSTNKITPISSGDSYDLRIDIEIVSDTGTPTILDLDLDIGGSGTITNSIVTKTISLAKTPPYSLSVSFPIFTLTTFLANGGQFFLATDSGTVTIGKRNIFIKRDYSSSI